MNKKELGSKTAKGGFANGKIICRKFNSWQNDNEAYEWLKVMATALTSYLQLKQFKFQPE